MSGKFVQRHWETGLSPFQGSLFLTVGTYTIVIHADGYRDKSFEVEISEDALLVPFFVKAG